MRKRIVAALGLVGLLIILAALGTYVVYRRQGLSPGELAELTGAKVEVDEHGFPTITTDDWSSAMEAQGYVVASERLFQMDLMRRAGAGRLAEWFGPAALDMDRYRCIEDWSGVAARAFEALPPEEKALVEAYARGVNRFIRDRRWRWGLEYLVLRTEPEPWEGRDTMLVLLSMVEQLTASAQDDVVRARWFEGIGPEWMAFLFPSDHPWNQPMFGAKLRPGPALPKDRLALRPIDASESRHLSQAETKDDALPGSNNWGWCGKTGCFLANDPHLGASVPETWYGLRLRVGKSDWVAGVALPGIPGVVLGMNGHVAWAFTNVGEDVDDVLREKLSPDKEKYLAAIEDGREVWQPLEKRDHVIHVRGGEDVHVVSRHTRRGPLVPVPNAPAGEYSREWLPYFPGTLRLPMRFALAQSWEDLNAILDDFRAPAQNVVGIDQNGTLGYRASGTGIRRRAGMSPEIPSAIDGEWLGLLPPATRPRQSFAVLGAAQGPGGAATATVARFLATANERIWVDDHAHAWVDDLRKDRIRRVLGARDDLDVKDMEHLQEDTESRYHKLLLTWVASHAEASTPESRQAVERWSKWSGVATEDPATFADALAVDAALQRICLDRLRRAKLPESQRNLPYETSMKSAWVITILEAEDGPSVFGLESRDLARHLVDEALVHAAKHPAPYSVENRWRAQHPFVGHVPWIGALFAVDEHPQVGSSRIVRVERPKFGASVRLVWDVFHPERSTWIFPVGQSGHPSSPHFKDQQGPWSRGERFPVFEPSFFQGR